MIELINNQKTVMISSIDENNNTNISYSAYVFNKNKIYIYISQIAKHYDNLMINPNISIMIIEDEKECKTVFDRKRVYFDCVAKKLIDNEEEIYDIFDDVHGAKIMKILKTMDFNIFELDIVKGRYIEGFTRVYDVFIENNKFNLNKVDYKNHIKKLK